MILSQADIKNHVFKGYLVTGKYGHSIHLKSRTYNCVLNEPDVSPLSGWRGGGEGQ